MQLNSAERKIIYIDCLSIFSLLSIILSRIEYSHIFYLNKSFSAEKLASIFLKIGLIKNKPQLAEFYFEDLKDEKGGSIFYSVQEDIQTICTLIRENEFTNNISIKNLSSYFPIDKLFVFLEKLIFRDIQELIIFINYAIWHARENFYKCDNDIVIFLERGLWSKYLALYVTDKGLKAIEYLSIVKSYFTNRFSKLNLNYFLQIAISSIKKFRIKSLNREKMITSKKISVQNKQPIISALYTGRKITLDIVKRSDFFWLIRSNIPHKQVLIYIDSVHNDEMLSLFKLIKLKYIQVKNPLLASKNLLKYDEQPVWLPSPLYKKELKKNIWLLIKSSIFKGIKLNGIFLRYLIDMTYFMINYSYWYDFIVSNNIKINLNKNSFLLNYIPFDIALYKSSGISIHYQESNLDQTTPIHSIASDIVFSFSPYYQFLWAKNNSSLDYFISCGYITDYAFKEARESANNLRNQLLSKGVNFVLCYFDENSSDSWTTIITNKKTVETYKYFLQKIIEDETLGIIFQPKKHDTIYQRLLPIKDLIEKVKRTQRCIFIDEGKNLRPDQYPTEAAQASDVCVGLLLSGTVALESYLSGTPTVFLDLEKFYSKPIYEWGEGKVVFDNLDSLFSAVQQYRESPSSIPGFGDLSFWAKSKDPFKDGNASLRIGQYVSWLLEKFNQGGARDEAIEYANQKYAELWGKENVIRWH